MDITPSAYEELFRRASRMARRFHDLRDAPETLSLFHRALLRFPKDATPSPTDRDHFYRSWYVAMRTVLIDLHRAQQRRQSAPLPEAPSIDDPVREAEEAERLARLDGALADLAEMDELAARIVHLRYFDELTWHEIAGRVGCSYGAVQRKWTASKAWLRATLRQREEDPAEPRSEEAS